jgi:ligand-binding sensor domain-containing protein
MLFGFLKGFLLVLVILAALLPAINLMSTGFVEAITSQLAHSHIAGYLYNENFILMLIQNYLG